MLGFGAKKQTLIIGNDGVQLYLSRGKRTTLYADFSDAGGMLSSHLKKAFQEIDAPLTLVFDVVEQQYRKETLPRVSFLDKNKVIQRKLMMAFPQQQMRAFLPLKQVPREGEGMVALFAGLAPNLTMTQVMDAVVSSEIPLRGGVLLPVESTTLLNILKAAAHKKAKTPDTARWAVLMTYHKTGGLRQIVIKDGELALTRLTPLAVDTNNTTALAVEMNREFNATMTYLSRFGFNAGDGLDLILVTRDNVCDAMRQQNPDVTHLYALSNGEAGRLLGLDIVTDADNAVYGDALHAAWSAAQRKLLMPLAAPLIDRITNARQVAQAMIVIMLFGLLWVGYQAYTLQMSNQEKQEQILIETSRRASLQSEVDTLSQTLNKLKYSPEQTKMVLDSYDGIKRRNMPSEMYIERIISNLDKGKMILKKISFTSESTTSVSDMMNSLAGAIAKPEVPTAETSFGEKPKTNISFEVSFVPSMSLENAASLTNEVADKLRAAFPQATVTVDKIVGNLSMDKTVQGVSEQIAVNQVEGRLVKDETSTFQISGVVQ